MPWLAVNEIKIPQFTEGDKIDISRIEVDEVTCLFICKLFTIYAGNMKIRKEYPDLILFVLHIHD